jgi:trypsin
MKSHEVEKTFIQPQSYTREDDVVVFDVALLKLKTPIDFSATGAVPIAHIADQNFEDNGWQDSGVIATVLGWGATNLYPPRASQNLKKLDVPIVGYNIANAPNAYDGDVYEDNMIAAGYRNGGQDACYGDSGGPLVTAHPETGKQTLIGVVSWGEECARPNKYGVYAKVSFFAYWIQNTINNN